MIPYSQYLLDLFESYLQRKFPHRPELVKQNMNQIRELLEALEPHQPETHSDTKTQGDVSKRD